MKKATIYQRADAHGDWLLRFRDTVRDTAQNETFDLMTDAIDRANELGADSIGISTGRDGDLAPATYVKGEYHAKPIGQ